MINLKKLLPLSLCILFVGCELFNAPKDPDYFKKIDEEIAWANAPKLTVRLAYHSNWGSSTPVRGPVSVMAGGGIDIRKGYEFSLEFTPAPAYSLTEWRAYATAELPAGWEDDTGLLDPDKQLDGVELPEVNPNGGNFTFKLSTTTPATLIPICVTQPRVIRTEPRDDPDNRYSRATPITIYFNAQMNKDTVELFGAGFIEIKDGEGNDLKDRFIEPVYTDLGGFHYATINPNGANLPPFDTVIRVYVGENLKNIQENEMANNAMSFSFRTITATVENPEITSWSAVYSENATSGWIDVTYTSIRGTRTEAVYRENRAAPNEVPENGRITTGKLNANAIRQGTETNGISEYEITIRVFEGQSPADAVTFRIWNVPGMDVRNTTTENLAVLTQASFDPNPPIGTPVLQADSRTYVLTEDIVIENHTPIDNFTGNFYGNGHTITIKSFASAYTGVDYGYFGTVSGNAIIRDVSIMYDGVNINTADRFGGISGTVSGNARLENMLVKGAVSTGTTATVGGMAEFISGAGVLITNAYSGLGITITSVENVGGVAGRMTAGTIDGVTVSLNISMTGKATSTYTGGIVGLIGTRDTSLWVIGIDGEVILNDCIARGDMDIKASTELLIGGIIGVSANNSGTIEIRNSFFEQGNIIARCDVYTEAGGFGTYMFGTHTIVNCGVLGGTIDIETVNGALYAGGFISDFSGSISNCFSRMNVAAKSNNGAVQVGGFIGVLRGTINNSYASGTIRAVSNNHIHAGGLVGTHQGTIQNSYAAGNVIADGQGAVENVYAGGLVGANFVGTAATITNCFSIGQVTAINNGTGWTSAGGIVGHREDSTISNCAALGASVTALGTAGNRNAGRIYGYPLTNIGIGNRANRTMDIEEDIYNNSFAPATRIANSGLTTPDGADTAYSAFLNQTTWSGMGFNSTAIWNFNTIATLGYPILRNVGGQ